MELAKRQRVEKLIPEAFGKIVNDLLTVKKGWPIVRL